jgi:hypothetical protein
MPFSHGTGRSTANIPKPFPFPQGEGEGLFGGDSARKVRAGFGQTCCRSALGAGNLTQYATAAKEIGMAQKAITKAFRE